MQKIKYTFADGTTSEIEVTDELYSLHLELVQQEKRNHWRETRRHTSLNYLLELCVDFADTAADPFAAVELRENDERIQKAISNLLPEQQEHHVQVNNLSLQLYKAYLHLPLLQLHRFQQALLLNSALIRFE